MKSNMKYEIYKLNSQYNNYLNINKFLARYSYYFQSVVIQILRIIFCISSISRII